MKTSNKLLITAGAVIIILIFSSIVISRGTVDELLQNQQFNVSLSAGPSQTG
jgi:hypothetical protein